MQHRADAHENTIAAVAQLVRVLPRLGARDPLRLTRSRRNLAIERHRCLKDDEGTLLCNPVQENLVEPAALILQHAAFYFDACILQNLDALARHQRIRVSHTDDDAPDSRLGHSLGAGARATIMRAGLQRHIERRPLGQFTRHAQGMNLGMRRTRLPMPARSDDVTIAHDDSTNERIRRRASRSVAREGERLPHEIFIALQTTTSCQFQNAITKSADEHSHRRLFPIYVHDKTMLTYLSHPDLKAAQAVSYCRLWNHTRSCSPFGSLAGSTAGGDSHPASRDVISWVHHSIYLPYCQAACHSSGLAQLAADLLLVQAEQLACAACRIQAILQPQQESRLASIGLNHPFHLGALG